MEGGPLGVVGELEVQRVDGARQSATAPVGPESLLSRHPLLYGNAIASTKPASS